MDRTDQKGPAMPDATKPAKPKAKTPAKPKPTAKPKAAGMTKQERYELDKHAEMREHMAARFAAVETFEGNHDTAAYRRLVTTRDDCAAKLGRFAAKLRARGYTLDRDDSEPVAPAPEKVAA
jgi:type IV pilus biogenesis protein CpaD/CtpE